MRYEPFFSVVMPLYNKEKSVGRALASVLSQTFTSFELIIVDDGSTDNSINIVLDILSQRKDCVIIRIVRQFNKGPGAARNAGVKASICDYICFIDADDEWHPNFLSTMYSLVNAFPDCSLYCSKYRTVDEKGKIIHYSTGFPDGYKGYIWNFYNVYSRRRGIVNSSSACVHRDSLNKIGGFPESARKGEDIYTWLRLADIGKVCYANIEQVTIYRNAENRSVITSKGEIPYHIKNILSNRAKEFKPENRRAVLDFTVNNAIIHAWGFVLTDERYLIIEIAKLVFNYSFLKGVQALIISRAPSVIVKILRFLRNRFE